MSNPARAHPIDQITEPACDGRGRCAPSCCAPCSPRAARSRPSASGSRRRAARASSPRRWRSFLCGRGPWSQLLQSLGVLGPTAGAPGPPARRPPPAARPRRHRAPRTHTSAFLHAAPLPRVHRPRLAIFLHCACAQGLLLLFDCGSRESVSRAAVDTVSFMCVAGSWVECVCVRLLAGVDYMRTL